MTENIQPLSISKKKQNRESVVYVWKYRSYSAPSISTTADIENHKETLPTGGLASRTFVWKEINSEEIEHTTGKDISVMEASKTQKRKKYRSNIDEGSSP